MSEKKPYLTTDRAGYFVAGQRIPSRVDKDGNRTPKIGYRLMLSDEEAKYELLQGVIVAADEPAGGSPLSPLPKTASKPVEKPAGSGA